MSLKTSNLRQLLAILTDQVEKLEELASKGGLPEYPTLNDLAANKFDGFLTQPDVVNATYIAASAASQLAATLKPAGLVLFDRIYAYHVSSAIRIVAEACVPEILREAGPQGIHTKDIAAKTGTNATMIARALRLLATYYVFREVQPNVFAHNRISSMMDSGKPVNFVVGLALKKKANPIKAHGVSNVQGEKYLDTNGVPAVVEQATDEVYKSSAFFADVVLSDDYSKTSFQIAHRFDKSMWEFFEEYPGYLQRIQMAMVSWATLQPHQKKLLGFDWSSLPQNALVIDVGSGNGSQSFEIAKKAPHLRFLLQDREQTISQVTIPTWQANEAQKRLVESGTVRFASQDFFEDQTAEVSGKASVFYLRWITHDWPTSECVKILKKLHAAAFKDTKLILVDHVVPYACHDPEKFEGLPKADPPAPLLANLGQANSDVYLTDFVMAVLLNAQERTTGEFKEMTEAGGWEIISVHQAPGSSLSEIVCKKV